MTVSINGTSGLVFNDASTQATAATGFGFKNRIINGAMMIDQRNAGAAVTADGSTVYGVDRFASTDNTDGSFTVQQSSTAPAGFKNSLLFTVASTDSSLSAGQYARFLQSIEGLNVADLGWGTASASTVTLSFWVRSSVTGTFGAGVRNSAGNRGYPFSYTISAANTWEQKSVTIAGDTTGTWLTTNGIGLDVVFALGAGTDYQSTANTWGAGNYYSVSGATNLMATSGATFYITGVQLEKGSTATSFDYRPYGTELMLCRRYYQVIKGGSGGASSSTAFESFFQFSPMRSAPSASLSAAAKIEDHAVTLYTQSSASVSISRADPVAAKFVFGNFSGLTSSRYYSFAGTETSAGVLQLSAEL
jgi:hypothetical protein